MRTLCLRNGQRLRRLNLPLLRRCTRHLLGEIFGETDYELGIRLVEPVEMATINETFLQHSGSTDVITFDYSNDPVITGRATPKRMLHGEIFISIDDAVKQAAEFRTSWQSELMRYVVHGILHLRGFDDIATTDRRRMKREENRALQVLTAQFPLDQLERQPSSRNG